MDVRGVRMERLRDLDATSGWRRARGVCWDWTRFWRAKRSPAVKTFPGRSWRRSPGIARFCKPSSELHIETTWYRGTALEDLLQVPVDKVHTDRLYDGLDWLLPHKDAIEKHLKERLGNLFELKFDLLLYDVTSTYFEGECTRNSPAKRGSSPGSRPDCLPGLHRAGRPTEDGIPLGYEVFAGNGRDSTTVEEIVEAMEAKYGQVSRIWVMDRGMTSEKNLAFLRQRGGQYIVGTPKAMLRQFEEQLDAKGGGAKVQEGVEVQLVPGTDGEETFVLARQRRSSREGGDHAGSWIGSMRPLQERCKPRRRAAA